MQKNSLRATLFVACGALAAGCAKQAPAEPTERVSGVCDGERLLVVRNNTGYTMDIVESRIGSGARVVIASVGPGRHEIAIRNAYSYSARPGPDVRVGLARSANDVMLDYQCR